MAINTNYNYTSTYQYNPGDFYQADTQYRMALLDAINQQQQNYFNQQMNRGNLRLTNANQRQMNSQNNMYDARIARINRGGAVNVANINDAGSTRRTGLEQQGAYDRSLLEAQSGDWRAQLAARNALDINRLNDAGATTRTKYQADASLVPYQMQNDRYANSMNRLVMPLISRLFGIENSPIQQRTYGVGPQAPQPAQQPQLGGMQPMGAWGPPVQNNYM